MIENSVTISEIGACVNFIGAFIALWVMQKVTTGAEIKTKLGLIKFLHRVSLMLLSISMMLNAVAILATNADPRTADLLVEVTFLVVLAISAWRHSLAQTILEPSHG